VVQSDNAAERYQAGSVLSGASFQWEPFANDALTEDGLPVPPSHGRQRHFHAPCMFCRKNHT
jgi:hypothetical protein